MFEPEQLETVTTTAIPNSNPNLYLVTPILDDSGKVFDVRRIPIIGWRVEMSDPKGGIENYSWPIIPWWEMNISVNGPRAFYDCNNLSWWLDVYDGFEGEPTGSGLDALLVTLNKNL